jgi:hypothetical protein
LIPGSKQCGDMRALPGIRLGRLATLVAVSFTLGSCGPKATPAFFVPPTQGLRAEATGPAASPASPSLSGSPGPLTVPTVVLPSPTPPCTNGLTYLHDLSIPDGTNMVPGQSIDKQWLVTNSGTCNWDDRYRLKLTGGDAMGANPLLPLYPARAGAQAALRILFTAPQAAGLYQCQWRAVDPDGQPFGDPFYMQISVTP